MFELTTQRLRLRQWRAADRDPFAAMNADPVVMEFFPNRLTREQSDALVDRFDVRFSELGYCPWAVEELEGGAFIGFVGLNPVPDTLPCAPGVEVGWRLAQAVWGRGYATEAAAEAMRFGFEECELAEIVSFTAAVNRRSWRVMERLGMARVLDGGFDHPMIPAGHDLRPHVLYRASKAEWHERQASNPSPRADH
jgi:RimJ/RimL family protein N-acetyltransferase